ncbi:MAG: hypothetical protein ACI8RZ_005848 [Myxococcota bacterium]|jgi:hypothetical protein
MLLLTLACHVPEPDPPALEGEYGEILSETLVGVSVDMVAAGNAVYTCRESGGLQLWDVSDPSAPAAGQVYYESEACRELDIVGSRVFAGTDRAFRSYSPNNMMIRGEYITGYDVRGLTVDPGDGLAWLTGLDGDEPVLEKIEYREDADMRSIDLITLSGGVPTTLSSRPEGMFLLTESGEIQVLSTELEPIGEWTPVVSVDGAMMSMGETDYIYLSLGVDGILVLDARDPENLAEVGAWQGAATAGVTVLDGLLYVGVDGGVEVLDLTDPAAPESTGSEPIAVNGTPSRIWLDGGFGYALDGDSGQLTIFNAE